MSTLACPHRLAYGELRELPDYRRSYRLTIRCDECGVARSVRFDDATVHAHPDPRELTRELLDALKWAIGLTPHRHLANESA